MPELQWGLFWADLNSVRGSEQAGTRPVLVVSRESIHRSLPLVGVCPLTSRKPGRRIYATEVLIPAGHAGLSLESVVLAHQVRTIARERLSARLGRLEEDSLKLAIRQALALFFCLDA